MRADKIFQADFQARMSSAVRYASRLPPEQHNFTRRNFATPHSLQIALLFVSSSLATYPRRSGSQTRMSRFSAIFNSARVARAALTNRTNAERADSALSASFSKSTRATPPLRRSHPQGRRRSLSSRLRPAPAAMSHKGHRVGMILVHMRDDVVFGLRQIFEAERIEKQVGGIDPVDDAENQRRYGRVPPPFRID